MYKYAFLGFVGGLVTGLVVGKIVDKIRNKEFDEPAESWEDFREEEVEDDDADSGDNTGDGTDNQQDEKKDYTEYTEAYKPGLDDYYVDSSKKEHPEDDEEESDEDTEYVEVPNEDKEIKKYKKPRLIKEEEFGELSGYDKDWLKYYAEDDILCDENNEVLDEEYYLGDAMTKFGFKDNPDESEIFVRNSNLGMDFNVCKVLGSFNDYCAQ